jgi:hypothetical protein
MTLYLHFPIRLHGMVLSETQGQLYLLPSICGDRLLQPQPGGGEIPWESPLESPKRRCKDNINMNLTEEVCEDGRWIELLQNRVQCRTLVSTVLSR